MLKTRILTALALLPLVLASLFLAPPLGWGVFALLALSLGAWEWARFARFDRGEMICFVVGFLALGTAWLFIPLARSWALPLDVLALLFWLLLVPLWLRHKWTLKHKGLSALVGWLVLLAALAGVTRIRELPQGAILLLAMLAIAWVADVAAYFAGRAFGKRKLAPSISPGKSWEGVYGGLLAVALYVLALQYFGVPVFAQLSWWLLLPLAWALTAVSVMGDLFESLLKRQVGFKDSSNLLPGHGGVLDRVDSLLALVPVASALLFGYARLAV
ncbi:phosphatidate cytidylyltransferase [Chitinimonas arctica]|uniref:Phosphatidate cytidylyltransferase n=1 Tax=Chitinimonas arctica TaxID=2594795 RepID=A0A516SAQ1_9NEIS|nr:phosphatidate cytidylyltransferase [Chitinimonas arctica]QDQ25233.1 phosphatidate cytidylyltransferase [Chitinimonas arctica]